MLIIDKTFNSEITHKSNKDSENQRNFIHPLFLLNY
jgi:hypothetical protein